jgi:tripartite-type tricarboxylate transporter receptor subunit TctC
MSQRVWCCLGAAWAAVATTAAWGQGTYPAKPVRIVVPYSAGGNVDIVARSFAQRLGDAFGQQVLVDNRAGAGGLIGSELVARAAPDGHTLLIAAAGNHTINPSLYRKLPYDTVKDFAPVSMLAVLPLVLVVHPSVPVKTVKEVIALGKANPGQINAASGGVGTAGHMALELFMVTSGAKFGHIPYKGNSPGLADVVAGQLPLMFDTISTSLPHVKGGKLRGVAVTSPKRSGLLPDVPTIAEAALPGFEASVYNLMVGPAALPREIVSRVQGEIAKIVKIPDFRTRIEALGIDLIGGTPEDLGNFIRSDVEKWAKVVKAAGIKPE